MARVTDEMITDRVIRDGRRDHGDRWYHELTGMDIKSAWIDLRDEQAGGSHWMRHGAAHRGGCLLNDIRAERLERLGEKLEKIFREEDHLRAVAMREARAARAQRRAAKVPRPMADK